MFPHLSRRIPGFCTDIRHVFHIPTGTGYRTSERRPRISEPGITKSGRPWELNPWPRTARKVTPCTRIRKWNSGRIRRASAGPDRASREHRRVWILPRPGPGGLARGQLPPALAAERRDAPPGIGVANIPWAHGFVPEPVSPDVVAPAARCPGGVARAVMEEPFINLVAAAGTFRTWTPMRVAATCAAMGASLDIGAVADPAEAETRLEAGTRSSFRSGLGPAGGSSRRGPNRGGKGITVYIYRRPPRSGNRRRHGPTPARTGDREPNGTQGPLTSATTISPAAFRR